MEENSEGSDTKLPEIKNNANQDQSEVIPSFNFIFSLICINLESQKKHR